MLRQSTARAATAGSIALLLLSLAPVPALAGAECVWGRCVNGEGTMRYPDGRMESGTWREGVLVRPRLKIQDERLASRQPGQCVRGNCMNGEGKREYPDGSLYEGSFSASQRDGKGVMTWPNRARFEGAWMADKRQGHGVLTDRFGGRYDGQWRDDARTRKGVYVGVDGSKYQGDYLGDLRHGYGVLTGVKGDRYVGQFRAGEIHGVGRGPVPTVACSRGIGARGASRVSSPSASGRSGRRRQCSRPVVEAACSVTA